MRYQALAVLMLVALFFLTAAAAGVWVAVVLLVVRALA